MRLADADDAIIDSVVVIIVHPSLLAVGFMDHQQVGILTLAKQKHRTFFGQFRYGFKVTANIAQLFANGLAQFALGYILAFGNDQVLPTGSDTIGTRLFHNPLIGPVKNINDLFTFFPGRIQDFQICRKGDVREVQMVSTSSLPQFLFPLLDDPLFDGSSLSSRGDSSTAF